MHGLHGAWLRLDCFSWWLLSVQSRARACTPSMHRDQQSCRVIVLKDWRLGRVLHVLDACWMRLDECVSLGMATCCVVLGCARVHLASPSPSPFPVPCACPFSLFVALPYFSLSPALLSALPKPAPSPCASVKSSIACSTGSTITPSSSQATSPRTASSIPWRHVSFSGFLVHVSWQLRVRSRGRGAGHSLLGPDPEPGGGDRHDEWRALR